MEMKKYENFCLSLPNSELTYPFDEKTKVMKVANKMFAIIANEFEISLKCEPNRALEQRMIYEAVRPGYHLNKTHWNTVTISGDVHETDLTLMILHSYECVIATFFKKQREQLEYQLQIWQLAQEEKR